MRSQTERVRPTARRRRHASRRCHDHRHLRLGNDGRCRPTKASDGGEEARLGMWIMTKKVTHPTGALWHADFVSETDLL